MERSKTGGRRGTNGVQVKGRTVRRLAEGTRPEQRHDAATLSQIADLGGGSARLRSDEAPGAPETEAQHALPWLAILALIDHDSDTDFITNGLLNSIHPLDFLPTVARIAKVEVGTSSGDASLSARLSQPTNLAMIHHYGYN